MDSELTDELRRALTHLYDPVSLRRSTLIAWLGLSASANPAAALRQTIEDAILSLRPGGDAPPTSKASRSYQILYDHFVHQFTQRDVANQLGISPRHLRREQSDAIELLAQTLMAQVERAKTPLGAVRPLGQGAAPLEANAAMSREMDWIGSSLGHDVCDVAPVMQDAMALGATVAARHGVALEAHIGPDLPQAAMADTVLKQLLLTLLTTAVDCAPGGKVRLAAAREGGWIAFRVQACPQPKGEAHDELECEGIEMAERLVALFHGKIETTSGPGGIQITAHVPTAHRIEVLAIEDNLDTLQLWERYLQATPFRLTPLRDPAEAMALARELRPDLVVLDLMMPGVDGWELLGQLRNHPDTRAIPIIVCTVLPQEELALSLGAAAFVKKPSTRQEFLRALGSQSADAGRE